ncbi:uncharacterized protein ARMOST_19465 [Armillaria ostoyae]|uniref:Uncharacterized protein n=1 Tax=Armillaria ostoyae TaxID=47428 RepID=A0A284S4L9_ARMOS|nr:uncharacterized protein ARMOST_19465 [Armillaria ostoyae]
MTTDAPITEDTYVLVAGGGISKREPTDLGRIHKDVNTPCHNGNKYAVIAWSVSLDKLCATHDDIPLPSQLMINLKIIIYIFM